MDSLTKNMQKQYNTIEEVNKKEKIRVESNQKKIFASVAGGAVVAGAIASVLVAGPLGLGLFSTYAAASPSMLSALIAGGAAGGGIGGAGIGAGIKKLIRRRWLGTENALSKTVEELERSRTSRFGETFLTVENTVSSNISSSESSASNIRMIPENSCTMFNNTASLPQNNTINLSDQQTSSTQAYDSDNVETNTSSTNYLFAPPADLRDVAEFLRYNSKTNHFYVFTEMKDTIMHYSRRLWNHNYLKME